MASGDARNRRDGHATHRAEQLEPRLIREMPPARRGFAARNADMARGADRRERVELIVASDQRKAVEHALWRTAQLDGTVHRDRPVGAGIDDRGLIWPMREALDLAPATARKHAAQAFLTAVDDDATLVRNRAHQVMELRFNGRQVRKNVGVVVFEVVQDAVRGR